MKKYLSFFAKCVGILVLAKVAITLFMCLLAWLLMTFEDIIF